MATTAQTIIEAAFRKAGINNPSSTDKLEAFESLNNMISSWGVEFLNHYTVRESLALTIGTAEYTIGPTGDLVTVRPLSLKGAYLQNSEGIDTPLDLIGDAGYSDISDKDYESTPSAVYFVPETPNAKVIFSCKPSSALTAYFSFEKNFTEFASLTTTFALPNEYKEALIYNLAIPIMEDRGVEVRQTVYETAKRTKEAIARLKAINEPPPELKFDFATYAPLNILIGD